MKEANIIHENGKFWVYKLRADHFQVNATGVTHSVVLEAFADESLAVSYCDSLARRFPDGMSEQHLWKRAQPESA